MTEVSAKKRNNIKVIVATKKHCVFSGQICEMIEKASLVRGTGIAKRKPEYINAKIREGKAIIAFDASVVIGFCYVETWEHNRYVANSGLIVDSKYRRFGLAKRIKTRAFKLSRDKFPSAKIFGLTTSLAVMKINSYLGYRPVSFSELTKDDSFWNGCKGCAYRDILERTSRSMCLCTGMVFDPKCKNK